VVANAYQISRLWSLILQTDGSLISTKIIIIKINQKEDNRANNMAYCISSMEKGHESSGFPDIMVENESIFEVLILEI
jgi:hypothetical protein